MEAIKKEFIINLLYATGLFSEIIKEINTKCHS